MQRIGPNQRWWSRASTFFFSKFNFTTNCAIHPIDSSVLKTITSSLVVVARARVLILLIAPREIQPHELQRKRLLSLLLPGDDLFDGAVFVGRRGLVPLSRRHSRLRQPLSASQRGESRPRPPHFPHHFRLSNRFAVSHCSMVGPIFVARRSLEPGFPNLLQRVVFHVLPAIFWQSMAHAVHRSTAASRRPRRLFPSLGTRSVGGLS